MLAARMPTHRFNTTWLHRRDCLGGLAGLCLLGGARAGEPVPKPWPAGQPTPPLDLPGHGGPGWRLADAKGRPVLMNFWASWCEPCRSELPSLELLAERHQADGLVVMTIDYRETPAQIDRFLDLLPMSLPILRDVDGRAAQAWGARVFPTTVLVGRDGRPTASVVGEVDWMSDSPRRWLAPVLRR